MGHDSFAGQINDASKKTLLGMGGYGITPPPQNAPVHSLIFTHGKLFDPRHLQRVVMEISRPHQNSAELWLTSEPGVTICTGFALAAGGFWKRHSWLLDLKRSIIETTSVHEKYYGIGLRANLERHGAAEFIKSSFLQDPLQGKLMEQARQRVELISGKAVPRPPNEVRRR